MESITTYVTATHSGAAFPRVRSAWASVASVGANPVLMQSPVLAAAGRPDARTAALWQAPAPVQLLPMAAELPLMNENRKQKTVHKTRINAGGYGAMGPYPEREPA